MVAQNAADDIHTGLFGFAVVAGRDGEGVGACDYYWRGYGSGAHLAACGGHMGYLVGYIGISCLCMQFDVWLAEVAIGAY